MTSALVVVAPIAVLPLKTRQIPKSITRRSCKRLIGVRSELLGLWQAIRPIAQDSASVTNDLWAIASRQLRSALFFRERRAHGTGIKSLKIQQIAKMAQLILSKFDRASIH